MKKTYIIYKYNFDLWYCRVKYSGLYTYYLVLFLVGRQIWRRVSQDESRLRLCLSILWRLAILIIIPLSVYVGVFYAHLVMLPKAGPHDSVMTSAFQASLKGGLASITRGQPLHVAHGSQITLRYLLVLRAILCHQRIVSYFSQMMRKGIASLEELILVGARTEIECDVVLCTMLAYQNKNSSSFIFYAVLRDTLDRNLWRQIIRSRSTQEADHDP